MNPQEFEAEAERVIKEIRYNRAMQKKRLYEQAKLQRKQARLAAEKSETKE